MALTRFGSGWSERQLKGYLKALRTRTVNFDTPVGRAIKRRFRDACYVDTDAWKRCVFDRSVEMTGAALAGLAS